MKDKNEKNSKDKFEKDNLNESKSESGSEAELNQEQKDAESKKSNDVEKKDTAEPVTKYENNLADENIELSKNYNETKEKLELLEKENAELKDQLLRGAAEFNNFKKRNENERLTFLKYAGESIIVKILPIYDDLTRSLEHIDDENNIGSIKDGLKNILEKFSKTLTESGVKKIEAKGKQFDFNFHEALMQKENNTVPPHTVLEEIESGYTYNEKVIRHSKVIVSQEMSAGVDETDAKDNSELKENEKKEE